MMALNYTTLGAAVRQSALDAHEGVLPHVSIGWAFMIDNPECFEGSEWPDSAVNECVYEWPSAMPAEPPAEFIAAYYGASEVSA